jgi:catalase
VVAERYESRDRDDYIQAGNLWRIFIWRWEESYSESDRKSDEWNTAKYPNEATVPLFPGWYRYGQRVAQALNIQILPAMLQQNQQNNFYYNNGTTLTDKIVTEDEALVGVIAPR